MSNDTLRKPPVNAGVAPRAFEWRVPDSPYGACVAELVSGASLMERGRIAVIESLKNWAAERGYAVAVGRPSVLEHAACDIRRRIDAGEFASAFREAIVSKYRFQESDDPRGATAVIIFAIPRPAHVVTFQTENGELEAIVPPTYVRYTGTWDEVRAELAPIIPPERLHRLNAPLKAIAACLGLVKYGRNNISYAPGMGSYHQLVGFLTDVDCATEAEAPSTPERLPECERCMVCRKACPTGAVSDDRFLLRAERCLTWLNEQPDPWPEWVPAGAHNSLVGCMTCQDKCPVNKGKPKAERLAPAFTAEETATMISGAFSPHDAAWQSARAKLEGMGLVGYEGFIGRNLKALLRRA